jgi:hypothetical protein
MPLEILNIDAYLCVKEYCLIHFTQILLWEEFFTLGDWSWLMFHDRLGMMVNWSLLNMARGWSWSID